MKSKIVLSSVLLISLIYKANAGNNENLYATNIKRVENGYEFYVSINSKNTILIKNDVLEDVYYGDRKIPDSIMVSINEYNSKELIVYWIEKNTVKEGETGSDGTFKKYISIYNLNAEKEIFHDVYYHNESGWRTELINNNTESREINRTDYENTLIDCEITFSKNTITLKDKKNLSSVKFEYNEILKKYIQQ